MKAGNSDLFENTPVRKAVLSLVVPTVISQLINVVYNMADTFFIGQMGEPAQVAASIVAFPTFALLTGVANLLGIGGSSLISRSLGEGNSDKARRCAAFSIWTSIVVSLIYGLLVWALHPRLLPLMGANKDTYEYCRQYVFWTVTIGALPSTLNIALAHLVRSEGYSKQASIGVAAGGILNIALDPLFIFVFKLEIEGAAIATMLSNFAAALYFICLLYKKRKITVITFNPRYFTLGERIPREIMLVGLPSVILVVMGSCSSITLNNIISSYSNEAMAGMGIAKKIDMVAFAVSNGMAQGALPLVGYNYAAKNYRRMRSVIKTAFLFSVCTAVVGVVLLITCAVPVARSFINNAETVAYAQRYLRIICISFPCVCVTMMSITIFQATGKKAKPLFLSIVRKGGYDIPLMFLLNHLAGVNGIAWAVPISDTIAMLTSLVLFFPYWQKIKREETSLPQGRI